MITTAVRFYEKSDLQLESLVLPDIGEGEILAKVISDSIYMSTYKALTQGTNHKRFPLKNSS